MHLTRNYARDDRQACIFPSHHTALDIDRGTETGSLQQFERLCRTTAGAADQRDRLVLVSIYFLQPLLQLAKRNQSAAGRMPFCVFISLTHIKQ